MLDGTGVGRAPDHREDPQQEEDKSMTSSTIAEDQTTETMHGAVAHVGSRTSKSGHDTLIQVSGQEIFWRSLPTIAFVIVAMILLANSVGVFWGTTLLGVLVALMVSSIWAWIPKLRSR